MILLSMTTEIEIRIDEIIEDAEDIKTKIKRCLINMDDKKHIKFIIAIINNDIELEKQIKYINNKFEELLIDLLKINDSCISISSPTLIRICNIDIRDIIINKKIDFINLSNNEIINILLIKSSDYIKTEKINSILRDLNILNTLRINNRRRPNSLFISCQQMSLYRNKFKQLLIDIDLNLSNQEIIKILLDNKDPLIIEFNKIKNENHQSNCNCIFIIIIVFVIIIVLKIIENSLRIH